MGSSCRSVSVSHMNVPVATLSNSKFAPQKCIGILREVWVDESIGARAIFRTRMTFQHCCMHACMHTGGEGEEVGEEAQPRVDGGGGDEGWGCLGSAAQSREEGVVLIPGDVRVM